MQQVEERAVRPTEAETDRDALWAAVIAERPRAERIARARCSSSHDAEDCVQEAMARVVAMSSVDYARVGPLLATVTANLAADSHRGRAREAKAEPRLRAALVLEETPENAVCDAAEARWLRQRTVDLAAQDRKVLEMRAQGRSVTETAQTLGLTYKAAEASYTRARKCMRAIWRATAAALGLLWGRPQRRAAEMATLAAATAALAFTVLPNVDGKPPAPPAPPAPAAIVTGDRTTLPGSVESPPPPPPASNRAKPFSVEPPAPSPSARATPSPPPPQPPLLHADQIEVDRTTTGGAEVRREREDETLLETAERCLEQGLIVTPENVDCAG